MGKVSTLPRDAKIAAKETEKHRGRSGEVLFLTNGSKARNVKDRS